VDPDFNVPDHDFNTNNCSLILNCSGSNLILNCSSASFCGSGRRRGRNCRGRWWCGTRSRASRR
jgi:hypothetical protein